MDTLATPTDMLTVALAWCAAGCSVIPTATDGSKATLGKWKDNQEHAASADTIIRWFSNGHPGLGIVCGSVSGNLEMLELEGRTIRDGTGERFFAALDDHGLGDVKQRILAGYCEQSPSGGVHLLYRVDGAPVPGNAKLAQRPNPDPTATQRVFPLIETRGKGGYVIVSPSHGSVHESGRPWVLVAGGPSTVATITAEERAGLHSVARLFDETALPAPLPDPVVMQRGPGTPPGTDYNQRAGWDDVLTPAGWTAVSRDAIRTLWRRPGKRVGISAVTGGASGDFLYVWSTSTELPAEVGLSKWRTYALLNHAGDFSAAAKALAGLGYGNRPEQPHRPVFTVLPGGGGATAPVVELVAASTHARTDDALALTLVDVHGAVLRYAPERGRWLHWEPPQWHWCPPGGGIVRELTKQLGRTLPEDTPADVKHKIHALSAPGTTNIVNQAATDARIIVRLSDLDARAYELNTPGGTIDLHTGELRAADPSHLHTRITRATPDPDADTGRWAGFLADTFDGHEDIPGYLQRLVGYSAVGAVLDHVLPFCFGGGQNGKSAFLDALLNVLGDYASIAPAGFLMAQAYAKHETELADLSGCRFVVCGEVNAKDKFDEARVKSLTGGDMVKARFMRQDYFQYQPTHHLWLMGNHQPAVGNGGPAFWRRLRIVPFDNTVPFGQRVLGLADILARDHGDVIMAWLVAGAVDYLRGGLREPASVHAATDLYEHDQDSVRRFVEDCCHISSTSDVTLRMSIVRTAYERWCAAEGESPESVKAFGSALKRRFGVRDSRTRDVRSYLGLSLLGPFDPSRVEDARGGHDGD